MVNTNNDCFSEYVKTTLHNIKCKDWSNNQLVLQELGAAQDKANNEIDKHALSVISGALSMSYEKNSELFQPTIILADGNRSFAMEDIKNEDILILETALSSITITWVCAQIAHILWLKTNNYKYAHIAVSNYITLFQELFDPKDWCDCFDVISIAYTISNHLGKKTDEKELVYCTIKQTLKTLNASDPLFLSISLIELIYKDAKKKDLEFLVSIANKLEEKNYNCKNTNYLLAEKTFKVIELILKRLNNNESLRGAKAKIAEYFVQQADQLYDKKDVFRSIMLLKKACNYYNGIDKQRCLILRKKLEIMQQQSIQHLAPIKVPFDATTIQKDIDKLFDGLLLQEAIVQIGRITVIHRKEEVKARLIEAQNKFLFSSLFTSTQLNENGQVIQTLAPLDRSNIEADPDLLFKHMVYYVSRNREYGESLYLRMAFDKIRHIGIESAKELNFLVRDNPMIPESRVDIIREGLFLGLSGNLYTALHILLPQTEHLFRHLVSLCGDSTTFLNQDGTEEAKPLSQLFRSEKLQECYDNDVIFTFQTIMDVPIGANLRNLLAHGLLEPSAGNSINSLCFLCLLIKFLSWYAPLARESFMKLKDHDDNSCGG